MRIIKKLEKAYRSQVELVELEGNYYVLKTAPLEVIVNEKRFLSTMKDYRFPSLRVFNHPTLEKNQILLEYIKSVPLNIAETEESMAKWGAAVKKMHSITFDYCFKVTETGSEQRMLWNDFLRSMLDYGLQRQQEKQTPLSPEFLEAAKKYITDRLPVGPIQNSLLNCDLHPENILYRGDEVILYDKESEVFAGDPLYDLATICTQYRNRPQLLAAFMKGYGENVIENYKPVMELYIVIRALSRYPNPFEPYLKEILEELVKAG